jgi:hypothetical protein
MIVNEDDTFSDDEDDDCGSKTSDEGKSDAQPPAVSPPITKLKSRRRGDDVIGKRRKALQACQVAGAFATDTIPAISTCCRKSVCPIPESCVDVHSRVCVVAVSQRAWRTGALSTVDYRQC